MNTLPKTTLKKITTSLIIVGGIIVAGFILYVATIILWTKPKDLPAHDAIIVLTGAKGRIETGFELLVEGKAPTLLISGVKDNVTLKDLIDANSEILSTENEQLIRNHCCIVLDYVADTTETNATETTKWIKDNDIKTIILVTSASHMPRAFLQFHSAINGDVGITPYPYWQGDRLDLVTQPMFWQYAAREYFKFAGSLIRLKQG